MCVCIMLMCGEDDMCKGIVFMYRVIVLCTMNMYL